MLGPRSFLFATLAHPRSSVQFGDSVTRTWYAVVFVLVRAAVSQTASASVAVQPALDLRKTNVFGVPHSEERLRRDKALAALGKGVGKAKQAAVERQVVRQILVSHSGLFF